MILNLENIKSSLKVKNIQMEDDDLRDLAEFYLNRIVSVTGINIDIQTYHYTITNKRFLDKIVLPLNNIFDVDELHVDFELYDDHNYFVDTKNGVIFFKNPISHAEHIHIKYLVKPDEQLISNILSPLVADMIIDDQSNDSNGEDGLGYGEISSIHEGGMSISFKSNTSLGDSINKRLEKLTNGEISLTGKGIKKGAYYI